MTGPKDDCYITTSYWCWTMTSETPTSTWGTLITGRYATYNKTVRSTGWSNIYWIWVTFVVLFLFVCFAYADSVCSKSRTYVTNNALEVWDGIVQLDHDRCAMHVKMTTTDLMVGMLLNCAEPQASWTSELLDSITDGESYGTWCSQCHWAHQS